jgi:hypothetical protein
MVPGVVGGSILDDDDMSCIFIGEAAAVIAIFLSAPEHHS